MRQGLPLNCNFVLLRLVGTKNAYIVIMHNKICQKVDDLNRLYLQLRGITLKFHLEYSSYRIFYVHGKENNFKEIQLYSTQNDFEAYTYLLGLEAGIAFGTLNVLL